MNKINKFFDYLFNNRKVLAMILLQKIILPIPDKLYLKLMFRLKMGYPLNLENPQTFNEKLQWLKLYNRRPEYTQMVDKYAVKAYISSLIGSEYVIPTLGVWDKFEDINFDILPDQFVLKTTNGGGNGGVVVCKDKSSIDKNIVKRKLNKSLKSCIYKNLKEWPYKNVKPRIIAEKYIEDQSGDLVDYKFTCTDGVVHNVMLCIERNTGSTKFYFFDRDWHLLRLNIRGKNAPEDFTLPKPEGMDKMFDLAAKLSKGLPYARIDLYNVNGKIYFGEITFFPQSGFDSNLLPETDKYFGQLIKLPKKTQN